MCHDVSRRCISTSSQCWFGSGTKSVLLLGDSHAAQHIPMFEVYVQYSFVVFCWL
jgi:hypothetical protein